MTHRIPHPKRILLFLTVAIAALIGFAGTASAAGQGSIVFIKNNDGTYKEFDWQKEFANYPSCGETYDGRFPIMTKDLTQKTPLEGTIRYAMKSTGFLILFSIKTLKLRITIQDRALHKSNTVETGDFTLQGIKK